MMLAALTSVGRTSAQPVAIPAAQEWVNVVHVVRLSDDYLERPDDARMTGRHAQSWANLAQRTAIPAPFDRQAFRHESYVVLNVGRRGEATACSPLRASSLPQFDALSCAHLMRPGVFSAELLPRDMATMRWVMGVIWATEPAAEFERGRAFIGRLVATGRPPSPLSPGPRRLLSGDLRADDFDRVKDRRVPVARLRLHLSIDEAGRPTECRVVGSTGNRAIDARACQVLLGRSQFSQVGDAEGRAVADRIAISIDVRALLSIHQRRE